MRITGGQVFDLEQGFVSRDVCFDGEKLEQSSADGKTYDASGCYVIPGLTDLHFHGCVGEDFSDATPDGLQKMADYELSRGVTQICPAGMTLGEDQLTRICQNAAAHRAKNPGGAELVGLHLEGPFLCKAKKGAQNEAFLHDPDPAMLHRLQQAAQGMVKLVTLAAEQPGALEFIRSAQEDGITVSLGHTTADYDTACAAYEAGARQATHLFNAMPPFTHRAVLVKDRVAVLVRLDQVIANAKLKLHLGGQSLVSTDQLDRISRHDILEGEQNQRNAQKHRDELKHTFNDVLTHTTPLSRD